MKRQIALLLLLLSTHDAFLTPAPIQLQNRVSHSAPAFVNHVPITHTELSLSLRGIWNRRTDRNKEDQPPFEDEEFQRPSKRQRLRNGLRNVLQKSAALVIAASIALAPFPTKPAMASRTGTTTTTSSSSLSRLLPTTPDWLDDDESIIDIWEPQVTSMSYDAPLAPATLEPPMPSWLDDDILGETPPVRIPYYKKQHQQGPRLRKPMVDIFADKAEEEEDRIEDILEEEEDQSDVERSDDDMEKDTTSIEKKEEAPPSNTKMAAQENGSIQRRKINPEVIVVAAGVAGGMLGSGVFLMSRKTSSVQDEKQQLRQQKEQEYIQALLQMPKAEGLSDGKENQPNGSAKKEPRKLLPNGSSAESKAKGPNGSTGTMDLDAVRQVTPKATPPPTPQISLKRSSNVKPESDTINGDTTKSSPPNTTPRTIPQATIERNKDLKRNLEILDIVQQIRRRKTLQEEADREVEELQARMEEEANDLEDKRKEAMEALERIDARRLQTAEENARRARELAEGIERIQQLRQQRKLAREREEARKQAADRLSKLTAELERKERIKREQKLERNRRKMMEERLYLEQLLAAKRKRDQREMAQEIDMQRQRQEQIEKYGSVLPEPPIRAPPVGVAEIEPKATLRIPGIPFFATALRKKMVGPPATQKVVAVEAKEAKEDSPSRTEQAPVVAMSEVEQKEKAEIAARALLEARISFEAMAESATSQTKEKDTSSAGESFGNTSSTVAQGMVSVEDEQRKRETEMNTRALLAARLALQAKAKTVMSEDEEEGGKAINTGSENNSSELPDDADRDTLSPGPRSENFTTKNNNLERKRLAEATMRALLKERLTMEARRKENSSVDSKEAIPSAEPLASKSAGVLPTSQSHLEKQQKAEMVLRTLLEARLDMEAKPLEKPKPIPESPLKTIETATVLVRTEDENAEKSKREKELLARALLQSRITMETNAKIRSALCKKEQALRALLAARLAYEKGAMSGSKHKADRVAASSAAQLNTSPGGDVSTADSDFKSNHKVELAKALEAPQPAKEKKNLSGKLLESKQKEELTLRSLLESRLASSKLSTADKNIKRTSRDGLDQAKRLSWEERSAQSMLEVRLASATGMTALSNGKSDLTSSAEFDNGKKTTSAPVSSKTLQINRIPATTTPTSFRNGFW